MGSLTINASFMLGFLAVVGVIGAASLIVPRMYQSPTKAFGLFAVSVITAEMAPLWLVLQILLAATLALCGALTSMLGIASFCILLGTWIILFRSVLLSLKTKDIFEATLEQSLGQDHQQSIAHCIDGQSQNSLGVADWFNPIAFGSKNFDIIRNLNYRPGGIKSQLDIYRPQNTPSSGCPVLLQIHGGAWTMGHKNMQALALMRQMTISGWICVDINYRLSPSIGMPTHIQDCKAALCWIREHGAEYGMNSDFVAVTGGSAGGHLSSLMALTANNAALQPGAEHIDTTVQACVPFYGPQDLTYRYDQAPHAEEARRWLTGTVMHQSVEDNRELWELVSPLSHIREDAPPYMVIQGLSDSVVPPSDNRVFVDALRIVSNSPVVYAELPGADHSFDAINSIRTRYTVHAVQRFLEWTKVEHKQKTAGH